MGITIGKAIPVHWVNTTYTSVDAIGSGGVYTGVGGSRSFRECKRGVNQLGQAGLIISFRNDSNKTIKYVIFTVAPIDRVNSRIAAPVQVKATGPIKPHAVDSCQWDYMWQSGALKSIAIDRISVEYMDGTIETFDKGDIEYSGSVNTKVFMKNHVILLAIVAAILLVLAFMFFRPFGRSTPRAVEAPVPVPVEESNKMP